MRSTGRLVGQMGCQMRFVIDLVLELGQEGLNKEKKKKERGEVGRESLPSQCMGQTGSGLEVRRRRRDNGERGRGSLAGGCANNMGSDVCISLILYF